MSSRLKWHKHEQPSYRDPDYLAFIRHQPCVSCHKKNVSVPHHTTTGGVALKGSDFRAVPLCGSCHHTCHSVGQETYQREFGLDFEQICLALHELYLVEGYNEI